MQLKFIEDYKIIKRIQTKLENYVNGEESDFVIGNYWDGSLENLEDELFSLIDYYFFDNNFLTNEREEIKFYKIAKHISFKVIDEYIKTRI